MTPKQRTNGIVAVGAGLVCLAACASTAPAPIAYATGGYTAPSRSPLAMPGGLAMPPFDQFTTPRIAHDLPTSECVPFARSRSGIQIWGDAVTWWSQAEGRYARSRTPAAGSVLVLNGYLDDKRGHISVVKAVLSPRMIRVDHANWLSSGEVTVDVPVIDVSAANDWSEVRVWHVPGMHWGGRVYSAEGFIHPVALNLIG